jgi:hypothetical protein
MESSEKGGTSSVRSRRGPVYALIAFGTLLLFLSAFAIWANRQLLETDTWVDTSSELLEDEEIRTVVADFTVDELFTAVDVEAQLQAALPPRAQPAAGVLAGGARNLANDLANEALQRPRVQHLWEETNRTAHEHLVEVVEDDLDEPVTLNLGEIVGQLGDQLGVDASSKIPPDAALITILEADQLAGARKGVKLLKALAIVLLLLALALYGLAIYLATEWRREALRNIGFAFILIGLLVLVIRGFAGNALTESLASTASIEPAVRNTWTISTSLLAAQGGAAIFYGLFIVVGAWLAAPRGLGNDAQRAIAPILAKRTTAYLALALLLLLLFWWAPTPGFQRLPTGLLLIALSIVGLEFLRQVAIRNFPDATLEGASERMGETVRGRLKRDGS